jgi:hypothetical protein
VQLSLPGAVLSLIQFVIKRLAAGESRRAIGKTMGVHHATIARLAG